MMPLSDPGPRLLPSTLALHRANHLLNSRNLQSEPLPHPLPPSLHPPAPVDLAEFDIDFILGGSLTQLGGDKLSKNAPVDVAPRRGASIPSTPTLKLGPGGVDEDTFAKFVGEFDDEYGDRRGEWTFRACNPHASAAQSPTLDSGLLTGEWESAGAGRYELFANGEVRSAQQGRVWRVRKIAKHEYELEEMKRGKEQPSEAVKANESAQRSTGIHTSDCYILACKSSHCEEGGVKLPTLTQRDIVSPKTASASKQNSGPKLRISFSDSSATERTARVGSSASTARTMAAFSQSLPLSSVFLTPRKKSQASSRGTSETVRERGRASISHAPGRKIEQPEMMKRKDRTVRPQNKEHDSNDKRRDRSLGGVFKRGIMAPFKSSVAAHEEKKALKDQRERERLQSQSWSRSGSIRTRSPRSSPGKSKLVSPVPERSVSTLGPLNTSQIAPSSFTEKGNESWLAGFHQEDRRPLPSPKPQLDDVEGLTFREGKAWHYVPDEAVAMVVPIDNDENRTPRDRTPHYSPFFVEGTRQALLVWYVPFNSETDERSTTASTSASSSRPGSDSSSSRPVTDFSYSLPKFQKLLRRHASKEKEATKRHRPDSSRDLDSDQLRAAKVSCFLHPLPFRSFRVVARVVDVDDLRSEPYGPATSFEQWREQQHRLIPQEFARTASASSSNPSPNRPHSSLPLFDDADTASGSTAPTSTIMAGRTFPTVIAVCHSRNQGVEFVLEGLDRLGFCKGESAWGPTGYEEWRGSGLSDKGRDLLDLLWAGCTGVMGLSAQ